MSLKKMMNSVADIQLPCGTPVLMLNILEFVAFHATKKVRSDKKFSIHYPYPISNIHIQYPTKKAWWDIGFFKFVDDAFVGCFIECFFEVEHDATCMLFFIEAFCDELIESGDVIMAAVVFSET
jgi:hypothetical protein